MQEREIQLKTINNIFEYFLFKQYKYFLLKGIKQNKNERIRIRCELDGSDRRHDGRRGSQPLDRPLPNHPPSRDGMLVINYTWWR